MRKNELVYNKWTVSEIEKRNKTETRLFSSVFLSYLFNPGRGKVEST